VPDTNGPLRRKRADLLATTGAAIAGLGAGALAARQLEPLAVALLVAGGGAHAVGMSARHRLERLDAPLPAAYRALYWACWLGILAVAGVLVHSLVRP
jgi:hypothetical protein